MTEERPLAKDAPQPTDTIASLIEERRQFEDWVTALDARQGSVPPAVYARVRADYETRLGSVLDRIGSRSGELRETVESLSATVASLQREGDDKRDERAEAEVRAAVGEYSEERWEELRTAADAELERIDEKRGSVAAELARVQEMLAVATAPPRVATPSRPAPAPATASPDGPPPPEAVPAPPAPAAIASPAPRPAPTPAAPVPVQAPVPAAASVAAANAAGGQPVPPPAAAPAHAGMLDALSAAPTPAQRRRPVTASGARPAVTPGGVPVFLRDVKGQQEKTLRCAECGTMNVPTEWYCERCGGELAAM